MYPVRHLFVHSFIHSFVHSLSHSFSQSSSQPLSHSFIQSCIHPFIHSFIHSVRRLVTQSVIHSCNTGRQAICRRTCRAVGFWAPQLGRRWALPSCQTAAASCICWTLVSLLHCCSARASGGFQSVFFTPSLLVHPQDSGQSSSLLLCLWLILASR